MRPGGIGAGGAAGRRGGEVDIIASGDETKEYQCRPVLVMREGRREAVVRVRWGSSTAARSPASLGNAGTTRKLSLWRF